MNQSPSLLETLNAHYATDFLLNDIPQDGNFTNRVTTEALGRTVSAVLCELERLQKKILKTKKNIWIRGGHAHFSQTINQIANSLCISASSVKRSISLLRKNGLISVIRMRGLGNVWLNGYSVLKENVLTFIREKLRSTRACLRLKSRYQNFMLRFDEPSLNPSVEPDTAVNLWVKMTPPMGQNELPNITSIEGLLYKGTPQNGDAFYGESVNLSPMAECISPSGVHPSTKMVEIWNDVVARVRWDSVVEKNDRSVNHEYLCEIFNKHFSGDMQKFREHCRLIQSSKSFLMNKRKFKVLSLMRCCSISFINKVRRRELGIEKKHTQHVRNKPVTACNQLVGGASLPKEEKVATSAQYESVEMKAAIDQLMKKVGEKEYIAWFSDIRFREDGEFSHIKNNRFVETQIYQRFGHLIAEAFRKL